MAEAHPPHSEANPEANPEAKPLLDEHTLGVRRVINMVKWLLYMVFVVIGFLILRRLAPVLTPVFAAAGIAYLLDPLVDRLVARGFKRVWAVTLLLVLFLGSVTTLIIVFAPLMVAEAAAFIRDLPDMVENTIDWVALTFQLDIDPELRAHWPEYLRSEEFTAMLKDAAGPMSGMLLAVIGGFFSFLGFLAELLLIPVFAFYFLLDWNHMVARVRTMIPPRYRANMVSVVSEIDSVVSSWIRGQFTVVAVLAVLYAICFFLLGVPLGVTVGLIVGLLTIIPFVGTFVGAAITALLLLLDWGGPKEMLFVSVTSTQQLVLVGLVFAVLHLIEAAVLTPKLVGKRVGLGEVGALFAVVAGGQLLGFTGVLLAMPIAASVAVLIRRLVRYYEHSAFYGARDLDTSIGPDEAEELARMMRENLAVSAIALGPVGARPASDARPGAKGETPEEPKEPPEES
jgi:predicted PurR-regulated permease PerM